MLMVLKNKLWDGIITWMIRYYFHSRPNAFEKEKHRRFGLVKMFKL